jgi:hypothetical protein
MTVSSGHRIKLRWGVVAATVGALIATMAPFSMATHDTGTFELDKNASNDTNITAVGWLASNVNASAPTLNICQTATGADVPANGDVIQIRAEQMTVVTNAPGTFGGNCTPGVKRSYTVTRGTGGTTAASQQSGANNVGARVSLIKAAVKDGPDWDQVYAAVKAASPDTVNPCAALGLDACTFIEDGIGPTTFTGGSTKDHLPIEGWKHTSGSSPDKGEILNAYAARATNGNSDSILTFGMDRYAVDGSTDIGFWFFQDQVIAEPDGTFSGTHLEGDLLILGTFTQGGATSDIRIFKWVGTGGSDSNSLNFEGAGADCVDNAQAGDTACATVNDTTIPVPWNYTFKGESVGGWVPLGGFFEGGVNLTQEGLGGCFSSFLAETRSSPSITAVLNDFALGDFEACDSGLTTTPSDAQGDALEDSDDNDLPDISIGTGTAIVRDAASLAVTGVAEWSGTLDFYLCGPEDVVEDALCSPETGTKIGSTIPVDQTTEQPILSDPATVTSAGVYCWSGVFTSSTDGVPDDEDSSPGECFEVLPVTPTITTDATDEVVVGEEISDSAHLAGTATQPNDPAINAAAGSPAGGTITFFAYGPFDAPYDAEDVCVETDLVFTSDEVPVSGDGDYDSPAFTPTAAGYYEWIASYSGDLPNTLGVSGSCGDANETTFVDRAQPTIVTEAQPGPGPEPVGTELSDTATLSDTYGDATGTITFELYGPMADAESCEGEPVFSDEVAVDANGATSGTYTADAPGYYNWIASYSGDDNNKPVAGLCGDDDEFTQIIQLQPAIATAQSFVPNDMATISVAGDGGDLAGTVVFTLYVDDDVCEEDPAYQSDPIDITGGTGHGLSRSVMSDNLEPYDVDATFHWVVEYTSTNPAHQDVASPCGVEHSSLTIVNDGEPNG